MSLIRTSPFRFGQSRARTYSVDVAAGRDPDLSAQRPQQGAELYLVEIVADISLRDTFGVKDGDVLAVDLFAPAV
jgi:hypothetical protein